MLINATPLITLPVNAALLPYRRVVLSGGYLAYAAAAEPDLGVLQKRALVTGLGGSEVTDVVVPNAEGTTKMIGSAAITQYADVYGAANGKVSMTINGNYIGVALTAATADLDEVEVLRLPRRTKATSTLEAKTANYTVTEADSGKTFSTTGAAGAVTFAMPAAVVGLKYRFRVGAAQELRIDPNGTETIALPSTGVAGAAGKYLTADASGETVDIECTVAGSWSVFGFTGTWTAEA